MGPPQSAACATSAPCGGCLVGENIQLSGKSWPCFTMRSAQRCRERVLSHMRSHKRCVLHESAKASRVRRSAGPLHKKHGHTGPGTWQWRRQAFLIAYKAQRPAHGAAANVLLRGASSAPVARQSRLGPQRVLQRPEKVCWQVTSCFSSICLATVERLAWLRREQRSGLCSAFPDK